MSVGWSSNHQAESREYGLQWGSQATSHSPSCTWRPRVRDWKGEVRIWKSVVSWLLGGMGSQQVLVGCRAPKATFLCFVSGHPHTLSQCRVCSYARSDCQVPASSGHSEILWIRCLNTVCKVKTNAEGSNARCAATQAGKMFSTEEIFIFQPVVTPLWSHCARLCNPNNWRTNPGEKESGWTCDQGTTAERG